MDSLRMDRLSAHLAFDEVACPCGKCDGGGVQQSVVNLFERIRAHLCEVAGKDVPILVTSGYRCARYNRTVPGAVKDSFHSKGLALDLACPKHCPFEVFAGVCDLLNPDGGVGVYPTHKFVHIDTRGRKARWNG